MGLLMWRLLQTKTKFIVIWTILFLSFFLFFILIELLNLRIFMFNFIIFPFQAIAYLVLTYLISLMITLIFYDLKWFIRLLLGFMTLFSVFIMAYFSIFMLLSDPKVIEINVNDETQIVVLESSVLSADQSFYFKQFGVFVKYINSTSTHNSEFRYGNYTVELISNEQFIIVFNESASREIHLVYEVNNNQVYLVETLHIDK